MAKANLEQKISEAALVLVGKEAWHTLTLARIASQAKIPLPSVEKLFASKDEILPAITQLISTLTSKAVGKPNMKATPHDRLFEVMMARYDTLHKYRPSILALMAAARRDPRLARWLLPAQHLAMKDMLQCAGVSSDGIMQPLAPAGLLTIHALTLCAWQKDQTADMSKTMATLDRFLRRAAKLLEIICRAN